MLVRGFQHPLFETNPALLSPLLEHSFLLGRKIENHCHRNSSLSIVAMSASAPLQPADQQFPFVDHFRRQVVVQFDQHLLLPHDLAFPCLAVESL